MRGFPILHHGLFLGTIALAPILLTLLSPPTAHAETVGSLYYVARDAQSQTGSTANPNFGRLTLLFNHGNHFHSLGRVGAAEGRVPESYIGGAIMMFGTREAGFSTQPYTDPVDEGTEYSDLEIRDIHSLASEPTGTLGQTLYNSSGNRWNTLDLNGGLIAFEIVELSSGLSLGSQDGTQTASSVGETLLLGPGSGFGLPFRFFTAPNAVDFSQTLEAVVRLVDLRTSGTPFEGSGNIRFVLQSVPEPSTWFMGACGLGGGLMLWRFQRARRRLACIA